jgi:predicted TIM-barrel fold metal-dependent hydrolase
LYLGLGDDYGRDDFHGLGVGVGFVGVVIVEGARAGRRGEELARLAQADQQRRHVALLSAQEQTVPGQLVHGEVVLFEVTVE